MRRRTILLATASLVYGSPSVFSVYDDFLAFPQFQVVFSDNYISDVDAESRLTFASSSSSARAKPTSSSTLDSAVETTAELSTWNNEPQSTNSDGTTSDPSEIPQSYEYMVLDSSPYLCSIPQVSEAPKNKTSAANSKAEEEKELARATDRGWELLKDLEGNYVKQFHQLPPGRGGVPVFPPIEDQQVPSYVLGKFQGRKVQDNSVERRQIGGNGDEKLVGLDVAQLQTKGHMRYLVQKLNGGTTCDLTGKERKIEVQFHCHPQSADRIGWIKEVATCTYLMMIYTPRLCSDVAFLPPKEAKAHEIVCHEIVPEDKVEEWQARKAAEADRKALNAGKSETPSRPVVGGIEVGGMKIIGKDGRRIEPPKAASTADGKADIVAKSVPNEKGGKVQKLSAADLKKMDLDPDVVEELRKKLQDLAGDKGWTLEVVDAPGGLRELRGIVDGDDDDDDISTEGTPKDAKEGNAGGDAGAEHLDENEGSEEIYKDEL